MRLLSIISSLFLAFVFSLSFFTCVALFEVERRAEYTKRNYSWPLQNYNPDTPGWKSLMEKRFAQIEGMPSDEKRYEAYLYTLQAALLTPNFTEFGFGLGRAPDALMNDLRSGIHEGLDHVQEEGISRIIAGPHKPWFIKRQDLVARVLKEMHPYAEAWSGKSLVPHNAYGFRLYRNSSSLYMHVDKAATHIVSMIIHIDSSDDAEPWPIFIEDFHGNTHEVILTSGDILFYESSKCFHGRPRPFKGTWYTSIFVHYYPVGWNSLRLETHYAVPPHWNQNPVNFAGSASPHARLSMMGPSFLQPDCEDEWCNTALAIKWSDPGEEDYWISPDFRRHPLNLDATPSSTKNRDKIDTEL